MFLKNNFFSNQKNMRMLLKIYTKKIYYIKMIYNNIYIKDKDDFE